MAAKKPKQSKRSDEEIETSDIQEYDTDHDDSRTVFFVGDITEELVKTVTEKLVHLAEKNSKKPIHLIINTSGGYIYDAFMLYDLIKYLPTPVYTVGLGKIMSAGCLLLAAGKYRKMGKNATLMYHTGFHSAEGSVWQIKNELDEAERLDKRYDELFAEETGMSLKDVQNLYSFKGPTADHYIIGAEALKLGIVDELI